MLYNRTRSFMNTVKTKGPTTNLWTTSDNTGSNEDVAEPYATYCQRSDTKNLRTNAGNHRRCQLTAIYDIKCYDRSSRICLLKVG